MMNISDVKQLLNNVILIGLPVLLMVIACLYKPNVGIAYCAVIIWFIFIYQLYQIDVSFFVVSFFLLFAQTSAVISGAYIESGNYILEGLRYGYATGATARLIYFNAIFFTVSLWCFKWINFFKPTQSIESNLIQIPTWVKKTILIFSWSILVILMFGLLKYGSPLLLKIDRFTYWTNHPFPLMQGLKSKLTIISFLCGLLVAIPSHSRTYLPRITVVAVIFINIAYGEKFSGIYAAGTMYFLPSMIVKGRKFFQLLFTPAKIATMFLCITAVLILIGYQYSMLYESTSAMQLIIDRAFALQGHVWWGIDEINLKRAHFLYSDFSVLIGKSLRDEDAGMQVLMYALSPVTIVDTYLANNTRFSMANPAIGLYALGSLGLFLYQITTGLFFGAFSWYFIRQISYFRLLRSLICVIIYTALFEALLMGNWYIVFSLFAIKYYALLVTIELLLFLKPRH